jgi:hypothetical protein
MLAETPEIVENGHYDRFGNSRLLEMCNRRPVVSLQE